MLGAVHHLSFFFLLFSDIYLHFFLDSLKASDVSYGFYRIVLTFFRHYSWFWGAVSMLFEAILRGSGLIFRIFWDSFGFYDVSNGFLDTSYELIRCLMAIILGFGGCFDAFWGDPSRLRAHFWDLLGSYEFLERISQLFLWLFWDLCAAFPSFWRDSSRFSIHFRDSFVFSRDFWWDFWRLMTHFWRFIGLFGPQQLFCGFSLRMSSTQFAFVISHLELFQVS